MVLENINQDLVSYYSLEEAGGTRLDFAGSNDLADINTVGQAAGKIGFSADFIPANIEALQATNSSVHDFGDEDFMFAGWFRIDSGAATGALLSKTTDTPASQAQYQLQYISGTDRIRWIVSNNGTTSQIVTANSHGAPAKNVFLFVVCWHDSVNDTINVQINNGTVDSVATALGINQGTALFRIGAHGDVEPSTLVTFLDGRVDELAVWNRILTSTERSELYNSGAGVNLQLFISDSDILTFIGGYTKGVGVGEASGFIGGYTQSQGLTGPIVLIGGYAQSIQLTTVSGNIGGYTEGDPLTGPTESIGGYLLSQQPEVGPTGIIGGYVESRGFLGPDGNIGGFAFSRATDEDNIFAILGGFLDVPGTGVGPVAMGGFALSLPLVTEDPIVIGGAVSGLFQAQRSIGGYSFGQPDFTNFVATRGRTIVVATSEDVTGQDLNIDAQIVFKALSEGNFNAKLDNIKTSQGDIIAAVQVEKFQLPPTVFIQSVELISASGETGPLNTLSPAGARQVCVIASGFLNDGDEFVSAHIDFADPFTNQPGTANKPFLSVSGFTGKPPWTACHDYDMSGIYKITARAQDNRGMVGMDLSGVALTSGLTAGIHYPVVSISGTPRFGNVPPSMQVNFTLVSSGLTIPPFTSKESNNSLVKSPTDDRILWQFGNRERSLKKNPFTFYQSPGLFAPKVMYKFNHPSGFGRIMVSDSLLIGFVR